MRVILTVILLLLTVLAADLISRFLVAVLAFAVAVVLFLVLVGVGAVIIVVGWSDESFDLMIGGAIVMLLPVFGAGRLVWRARG